MVCRPGQPCYSLAGKVIKGRSTPGYDLVTQPQVLGGSPAKSGVLIYNGAVQSSNPYGIPKTGGTGIRQAGLQEDINWGQIFGGFIVGVIFSVFVFTATGRKIAYKAGERVARRI